MDAATIVERSALVSAQLSARLRGFKATPPCVASLLAALDGVSGELSELGGATPTALAPHEPTLQQLVKTLYDGDKLVKDIAAGTSNGSNLAYLGRTCRLTLSFARSGTTEHAVRALSDALRGQTADMAADEGVLMGRLVDNIQHKLEQVVGELEEVASSSSGGASSPPPSGERSGRVLAAITALERLLRGCAGDADRLHRLLPGVPLPAWVPYGGDLHAAAARLGRVAGLPHDDPSWGAALAAAVASVRAVLAATPPAVEEVRGAVADATGAALPRWALPALPSLAEGAPPAPPAPSSPPPPLPDGWEVYTDDDGDTFFYHAASGVSQWERPGGSPANAPATAEETTTTASTTTASTAAATPEVAPSVGEQLAALLAQLRDSAAMDAPSVAAVCEALVALLLGAEFDEEGEALLATQAPHALVTALDAHPASTAIAEAGCQALFWAQMTGDPTADTLLQAGVPGAVARALGAHPSHAGVAYRASEALELVASSSGDLWEAAQAAGGLPAGVAATAAHAASGNERAALAAVHWLASCVRPREDKPPVQCDALLAAGGIAAVVAALKAHPGNTWLVYHAWTVLLAAVDGGHLDEVVAGGGLPAVASSLAAQTPHIGGKSVPRDLAEHGLAVLAEAARGSTSQCEALGACGGAAAIVGAMTAANTLMSDRDARAAINACWALSNMMYVEASRQAVIAAGGLAAIAATMAAHPTSATVAQSVCHVLGRVAANSPAGRAAAVAGGAPAAVVDALRTHPDDARVAEKACRALAVLCDGGDEHRDAVVTAGGPAEVVRALAAHPGSEAIALMGCRALHGLMGGSTQHREVAVAAGGVAAVAAAVNAHAVLKDVAAVGAAALSRAAQGPPSHLDAVAAGGGAAAVVAAAAAHPGDPAIARAARGVILALLDSSAPAHRSAAEAVRDAAAAAGLRAFAQ